MTQKLFVRFSTVADEASVFSFYTENQHQHVFQRDPEVWKERIASGATTIIHDEQGKILAAAIAYPVLKKDADGQETHAWTEIGSVRVAVEDAGLFKYLLSAHVLRAYLLEPPDERFIIEIDWNNTHSKHVFKKAGAVPYSAPPELVEAVQETIASGEPDSIVDWFQMGPETIPVFAREILEAAACPLIKNKKTGEEYELDYSHCVILTQFKNAVQTMAGQDFGDIKNPDTSRSLRSFKDQPNI